MDKPAIVWRNPNPPSIAKPVVAIDIIVPGKYSKYWAISGLWTVLLMPELTQPEMAIQWLADLRIHCKPSNMYSYARCAQVRLDILFRACCEIVGTNNVIRI